jgi:hypothetical protein
VIRKEDEMDEMKCPLCNRRVLEIEGEVFMDNDCEHSLQEMFAEIERQAALKDAEIERLRAALEDIAHGATMHPSEAEKLYRKIAEETLKGGE